MDAPQKLASRQAARQASRPAARPRPAPGLEAPRAAVTAKTAPVKALSLAERLEKLRKAWKMAKEWRKTSQSVHEVKAIPSQLWVARE